MNAQMSLFDDLMEQKIDKQADVLSVVNAKFLSEEKKNWQDLFEGFDEIYAITFSSGVDFVSKVLEKYKYGEVIFGCENGFRSRIVVEYKIKEPQIFLSVS